MDMKIADLIRTLVAEKNFERTPIGRKVTEVAIGYLDAAIEDKNNYDQEGMKCINCGFINSSLLFTDGCPNCGAKDLTNNINPKDILKGDGYEK